MTQLDKKFEALVQKFFPHSRLLHTRELKGGVSAQVTALEIEQPDGKTKTMIVRLHGAADLQRNPQIAADEFRRLTQLRALGLLVPMPYHFDQSGEIFSTPYIVVEYIDGKTEFASANLADCLQQMAEHLAQIHSVDCSKVDLSFLPEQGIIDADKFKSRPEKIDDSISEGRVRDILEAVWPLPQHNHSVLLHGDFWPGNLLWKDGKLVAVIDWEDVALGDPLTDLGNTRLEILWAFGIEAMHLFTDYYQAITAINFTNLPYWDLCAALRPSFKISEWAADSMAEQCMREGHGMFMARHLRN